MSDLGCPRRRIPVGGDDDPTPREMGERVLWAAVLKRALADAGGVSDNQPARREARRWFRVRSRDYIGGWGYVIDVLDLPPGVASRVERAAETDGDPLLVAEIMDQHDGG